MIVLYICLYILGLIGCLIWMGYRQRSYYDVDDYILVLVWPLFIICLIIDGYIWFCEKMVFLGRRLYNGSSKK